MAAFLSMKVDSLLERTLMTNKKIYQPPYEITPSILRLVAEIAEAIGRYSAFSEHHLTPRLRRENRIRTIQASLAIENNTLTLDQVTAVLNGKPVLGHPREIQEVRNAFAAYEAMERWHPNSIDDLTRAHRLLMAGLVDDLGRFRSGGVGIFRGKELVHMAPPAARVPHLMGDLHAWLETTQEHPLVVSCVYHYELEFIHPFADGNGRMGRLWQTLILMRWKPLFAYLPVETVIRDRQAEYYRVLSESDQQAQATLFIEFMLTTLLDAINDATQNSSSTDQVSDQVSDQVRLLLTTLGKRELTANELLNRLGLSHRPTFRKNYLTPALKAGWVEQTEPNSPKSPTQRYRLSRQGMLWIKSVSKA
jgi:Fic family protein